jgi:hypothetical protein
MNAKQINESFQPSIPNGPTVRALANTSVVSVIRGIVEQGTPGEYVAPFTESSVGVIREVRIKRTPGDTYDGSNEVFDITPV